MHTRLSHHPISFTDRNTLLKKFKTHEIDIQNKICRLTV
jgi:hypothetical protein